MNPTVDIPTAADLMGLNEGHIRRLCKEGKLPGAVRQGSNWQIPCTAHPKLAPVKSPEQLSASLDTAAIPPAKLESAVWKRGILDQCESFCAAFVRNGGQRSHAMEAFARQAEVPVRSLQRWHLKWRQQGLAGLVDSRGQGESFGPLITPEAWNEFLSAYLDLRQPTVKSCWQNLSFVNTRQNKGWTIPSLRTMQQYVNDNIPLPVLVLHREGLKAYEERCAPYIETDMDSIEPGAVWVGDHHQFDFWIRHRGRWIRPWITAWEDMRSRAVLGWVITPSPNSTTILQAFKVGATSYGPPAAVKIDNGKDYDSQLWTGVTKTQRITQKVRLDETLVAGLYAMMNIGVSFAQPYHPQSKSIERWFCTVEMQFGKTMPTYCGKDTGSRPEDLFDFLATDRAVEEAMDLDEFTAAFAGYIEVYNNTPHSGRGMNGQTPMQVMRQRTSRRAMAEGVMELLLRNWTKEITVGKNGVKVNGIGYGRYDAALLMHQGRKVRCTTSAEDIQQVSVYDAHSYQLLAIATANGQLGYGAAANADDLREATAQIGRASCRERV